MCGIAGVLGIRGGAAGTAGIEQVVRRMLEAQVHRGPDGSGVALLTDPHGRACGALGSRRLAVIDLTPAGRQPMESDDPTGFLLSYNGEVYNHEELRSELSSAGEPFRGRSDTEVVLRGLVRWGTPFLRRLRGMFALAFWDSSAGRLTLARDPLGIKPLYIAKVGGILHFASEVRALLGTDRIPRRFSSHALLTYLTDGAIREPYTAIHGVWQLPAGTVLHLDAGGDGVRVARPQPFGEDLFRPAAATLPDLADLASEVRRALERSVERHLSADVPIGVLLSGGIDSAAVTACATRVTRGTRLRTVTLGLPESHMDEARHARSIATRLATDHHEARLSEKQFLERLPAALRAMDQPTSDGINTFLACDVARSVGLKVVLSGLGGDDLFGGYPSFQRARRIREAWKHTASLRRFATRALPRNGVRWEKLRLLAGEEEAARAAYIASRTLFGPAMVRRLCTRSERVPSRRPAPRGLSLLGRVRWYELTNYTRNTLLRDSDVFSMAHGVELRVPFLDVELVRLMQGVADGLLVRNGIPKRVLAEALKTLLPPEARRRPKRGFQLPFDAWLRGSLGSWVGSTLSSDAVRRAGLEPETSREVWLSYLRGRGGLTWSRPWALFSLVHWAEAHDVSLSRESASSPVPDSWMVS